MLAKRLRRLLTIAVRQMNCVRACVLDAQVVCADSLVDGLKDSCEDCD
jgi:hypothetical protein